jgi:hypothetical protein
LSFFLSGEARQLGRGAFELVERLRAPRRVRTILFSMRFGYDSVGNIFLTGKTLTPIRSIGAPVDRSEFSRHVISGKGEWLWRANSSNQPRVSGSRLYCTMNCVTPLSARGSTLVEASASGMGRNSGSLRHYIPISQLSTPGFVPAAGRWLSGAIELGLRGTAVEALRYPKR